jgi:predicted RNA methylase
MPENTQGLPVVFTRGDSIAMDFIGPLLVDNGYDSILTIMDCLRAEVRIIPTHTDITASDLAVIFFNSWYCENGLPSDIVCDQDKLFVSQFWTALMKLMGVKIKMSTSYHPETDGACECTNKTVNQMLHFHIKCNQRGWVRTLP